MDYKDSGVHIEEGDAFARRIAAINSTAVSSGIGGFAGAIPLNLSGVQDPVLLSTTDGVGTKLLVAQRLNNYRSVGIDLVAMCVNDLVAAGARPLTFLDYIACGSVRQAPLDDIIAGIVEGCELAGCTLAGGETAEMPDMYGSQDVDLAGFATGVADRSSMLPMLDEIREGDVILGLRSNGVHSNGFSLARKALTNADESLWQELLRPTRIYVKETLSFIADGHLKAAAHITGGGLVANTERVLPEGHKARLTWDWTYPEIFDQIASAGSVTEAEMRKVFNMGIGMTYVVSPEDAGFMLASHADLDLLEIGTVTHG